MYNISRLDGSKMFKFDQIQLSEISICWEKALAKILAQFH